jgi:hypothetical protein
MEDTMMVTMVNRCNNFMRRFENSLIEMLNYFRKILNERFQRSLRDNRY